MSFHSTYLMQETLQTVGAVLNASLGVGDIGSMRHASLHHCTIAVPIVTAICCPSSPLVLCLLTSSPLAPQMRRD